MNKDKGAVARKACQAACIGCSKCVKECKFEAITVADNLSYIDWSKCRLCKKCVAACPTGAIVAKNFPAPKPVEPKTEEVAKPVEPKAEEVAKPVEPKAEEVAPKPIESKKEATEAAPKTIEPKDEAKEVTV